MKKYHDMRLFCLENGGIRSQRVKEELALRYGGEYSIPCPFNIGTYPAFIVLNQELQSVIASINQKNIKLILLSSRLPDNAVKQFGLHSMVEEIQQSNEFENVQSTRKEIRDAVEDIQERTSSRRFSGMVRKYVLLLTHKPISLRSSSDIRTLYDEFVLDEVIKENPNNIPDGMIFRKDRNYVNKGETVIHEGIYPEQKIIETMDSALQMLHDSSIDPLIRIAAFHYAFGYIHPFYDGNGRMTRFISSYMLSKAHYAEFACLRIAYVIKDHRQSYQNIFKNTNDIRSMGDLTRFVIEFLRFFEEAIDDAFSTLKEKSDDYAHYSALLDTFIKCHEKELGKYQWLLDFMLESGMFGEEWYDAMSISKTADISYNTVRKIIKECGELISSKKEGNRYLYAINRKFLDQIKE